MLSERHLSESCFSKVRELFLFYLFEVSLCRKKPSQLSIGQFINKKISKCEKLLGTHTLLYRQSLYKSKRQSEVLRFIPKQLDYFMRDD